jgi:peptidoglycan/xylan/chitin deacetylase (PgdA/CDA1 family)
MFGIKNVLRMVVEGNTNFENGKFVISIDFELFWGVRDKRTIANYGTNILGVQKAIPAMLELFDKYDIKATFSVVGFLFAENKKELTSYFPSLLPAYTVDKLSPYEVMNEIGDDERDDPYHFGYSLFKLIAANKNHEIGTHTFSHYYCKEVGQTKEMFKADLMAAKKIAAAKNIKVRSLVFPRNQYNNEYLAACKECGIDSYRGNALSWLYEPRMSNEESIARRTFRFIDAYINMTGHHCYTKEYIASFPIVNVPASRFLRPYRSYTAFLQPLRLRRITQAMRYAAKQKKLFHLWWHPHNFGSDLQENIFFLEQILIEFKKLQSTYQFQSKTMSDIADEINATELHA